MKTYLIIRYLEGDFTILQVKCEWRELLEDQTWGADRTVYDDDDAFEVNGRLVMKAEEMTEEELIKWFDSVNADGEPKVIVWCIEDEKVVLGGN